MKVETMIRHRTEDKIIKMSQPLVFNKDTWLERGGKYRGSLSEAASQGFFTSWKCEKLGLPVSPEEFENAKDFAMFKSCYMENILSDGKRPCLPVFYRKIEKSSESQN